MTHYLDPALSPWTSLYNWVLFMMPRMKGTGRWKTHSRYAKTPPTRTSREGAFVMSGVISSARTGH